MTADRPRTRRGQTLVEAALVLPLLLMVIIGIISLGIGIFYQQQVTNAAREAARWAAIHSATSSCATVGHLNPDSDNPPGVSGFYASVMPLHYNRCDRVEMGWPKMTAWARERLFGLPAQSVLISACWSGYRQDSDNRFDAPPDELSVELTPGSPTIYQTHWAQCTIGGHDPTAAPNDIPCTSPLTTVDQASSMSEKPGIYLANTVTAYACYAWQPPLAGFLLIPPQVELRGVITEPIQRQQ